MAVRRGLHFKADHIWDTPDDGNRYEVIDGELYVTPAPSWQHQHGLSKLHVLLGRHVYPLGLGRIVQAPLGVVLDEETAVQPDLVYVSRECASIIAERGIEGATDLIVEVLSPSTQARDRGIKMQSYAAGGIPHYWILDTAHRRLEAYRLGPSGSESVGVYGTGSTFHPELFPTLEISGDDLWS